LQKRLSTLALSLSVLAIAAPAQAQMRRSIPAEPVAPAESAAVTTTVRPANTVRIFIGPAFTTGGNTTSLTKRSQVTETKTEAAGTANEKRTTTVTNTDADTGFGGGLGLMYGVDGNWWATDRFGFGAGLFGAYLGAGQSNDVLNLDGKTIGDFREKNEVNDTKLFTNPAYRVSIPAYAGSGNYTVDIAPQGGLAQGTADARMVTTTYNGFTTPSGGGAFILGSGDQTAGGVKTTLDSKGGANFSLNRSVMVHDLSLHGDLMAVDTPAGSVSFFAGLTMPISKQWSSLTAKTVGDKGQGDEASINVITEQGSDKGHTRTTYKYKEVSSTDTSMFAVGPIVGLKAAGTMGSLTLFSQFGWAPVMYGASTTTTASSIDNTLTTEAKNDSGTTQVANEGTKSYSEKSSSSNQTFAGATSFNGAYGSVGVGMPVGPAALSLEGTARSYPLIGETIYGLKLGAGFNF
jgi:hypothetical protein